MNKNVLCFILLIVFAINALADESIDNNLFIKDYNMYDFVDISKNLRCVVCQNQNLYESDTKVARNLKNEIKSMLQNGHTKQEIFDLMENRYGEFVLYQPKLSVNNSLLWFFPLTLLFIALLSLYKFIYKRD